MAITYRISAFDISNFNNFDFRSIAVSEVKKQYAEFNEKLVNVLPTASETQALLNDIQELKSESVPDSEIKEIIEQKVEDSIERKASSFCHNLTPEQRREFRQKVRDYVMKLMTVYQESLNLKMDFQFNVSFQEIFVNNSLIKNNQEILLENTKDQARSRDLQREKEKFNVLQEMKRLEDKV